MKWDQLDKPLDASHVRKREGAGRKTLDYLEGWFVISEANRIFGFNGWSRKTVRLEHIGTIENDKKKKHVAYRATVLVTVEGVEREGSGYGDGIDANEMKAHELAIKESETDAMKRAFMTFGNPFGLALYDKHRNGVIDQESPKELFFQSITKTIENENDSAKLIEWWNSLEQKQQRKDFGLTQAEAQFYMAKVVEKKNRLDKPEDDDEVYRRKDAEHALGYDRVEAQ